MGEREQGLAYFFIKCSEKYSDERIVNIRFNCHDRGTEHTTHNEYSMCYDKTKPELETYCGPDWVFRHWPTASIHSFEDTRDKIIAMSQTDPVIDKVGWFGNLYSAGGVIEQYTRPLLKQLADQNPNLLDVYHIAPRHGIIDGNIPNYLSLPDLLKYKFLIDIGGNGYSGRLKFLLFSKRPLLLVDRTYVEFFHKDLIPYTHFIPVKADLSDLLEQIHWMRDNYDKSLEIAHNAFEFATRNFTMEKLLERVYYVYTNLTA